jgi:hypothetical protein
MTAFPSMAASTSRPAQEEGPTQVSVSVSILDVDEISGSDQNFTANVYYKLHWHDPRLAHENRGEISSKLDEIWHPRVAIVNQQFIRSTFDEIASIAPNGDVMYYQRVWGTFSQPLNLHDFPLDRQRFEIRLAAVGYAEGELELLVNESETGLAQGFSQPDWTITGWEAKSELYHPGDMGPDASSVIIAFDASRKVKYYVLKIVFPLMLIVAMSWLVFWIDPKDAGTQISVAITSMLTLIAYRFMVDTMLPPVSYLTRMDAFILASTVLVFATLIQVLITSTMAKEGRGQQALRLDWWCRILFPIIFAGLCYISFWSPYV